MPANEIRVQADAVLPKRASKALRRRFAGGLDFIEPTLTLARLTFATARAAAEAQGVRYVNVSAYRYRSGIDTAAPFGGSLPGAFPRGYA